MPSTRQAVTAPLNIQQLLAARNMGLGDHIQRAQMRNHVPSLRERLGNMIFDAARATGLRGNAHSMRTNAQTAMDFVPGLGAAIGGEEAGRDLGSGHLLSGGLGLAMSMVPGAGAANKGIRAFHGSPQKLDEIRPGMNEPGAWFSMNPQIAGNYARGGDGHVHQVELTPKNPMVIRFDYRDGELVPIVDGEALEIDNNIDLVRLAAGRGHDSVHFPDGNFSEPDETWVMLDAGGISIVP